MAADALSPDSGFIDAPLFTRGFLQLPGSDCLSLARNNRERKATESNAAAQRPFHSVSSYVAVANCHSEQAIFHVSHVFLNNCQSAHAREGHKNLRNVKIRLAAGP